LIRQAILRKHRTWTRSATALMNVWHNYPTELGMDTIGSPNKFSWCGAEPS